MIAKQNLQNRQKFNSIIKDYAISKVTDWVIKNKVDQGAPAKFEWTAEEKAMLTKILLNPNTAPSELPIDDPRYRRFFESIIENGLNTDDVKLFQKYKNKLPLRALGVVYDLRDFRQHKSELVSNRNIDAGYYMMEITISPKEYRSRLNIQLVASGSGDLIDRSFTLLAMPERVAKRMIKLDQEVQLKFKTNEHWRYADIKHFRLARLSRSFFLSRLYRKLGLVPEKDAIAKVSSRQFEQLWTKYDQVFESGKDARERVWHENILNSERTSMPSAQAQIENLIRWLNK